jgi:hypothetical protein
MLSDSTEHNVASFITEILFLSLNDSGKKIQCKKY